MRGFAAISSDTFTEGDAGSVVVTADRLTIRDFGEISSDSDGEGDAGSVVVTADDLTLEGGFIDVPRRSEGDGGRLWSRPMI